MYPALMHKLIAAAVLIFAVLHLNAHATPVSLRALRKMMNSNAANLANEVPSSNELGTSMLSQAQELDRFNAEAALANTSLPPTSSVLQEAPPAASAEHSISAIRPRKTGRKRGGKNFQDADLAQMPQKDVKLLRTWNNTPLDKIPLKFAVKVDSLRKQYYRQSDDARKRAKEYSISAAEQALVSQRHGLTNKRRRRGGRLSPEDTSRLDNLNEEIERIRAESVESQDVSASTSTRRQRVQPAQPADNTQRTSSRPRH